MAQARKRSESRSAPPATSLEGRENQLITLAVNLAEEQLRAGTASSQVITHYLKLGTTRERLEQERLRQENELARAKREKIQADAHADEVYAEALAAFRSYSGYTDDNESYYDD